MNNELELDSRNIARLIKILKYRIWKNKYHILKSIACYLYLFMSYTAIIYKFSYGIREIIEELGMYLLIRDTFYYLLAFFIINHLLIKKVVSNKIVLVIEIILLITLYILILQK